MVDGGLQASRTRGKRLSAQLNGILKLSGLGQNSTPSQANVAHRRLRALAGQGPELAVAAPNGVSVTSIHHGDAPAGEKLASRLNAIAATSQPDGDVFAFITAEEVSCASRALAVQCLVPRLPGPPRSVGHTCWITYIAKKLLWLFGLHLRL